MAVSSASRSNSPIPSPPKGKRGKASLTGFVLKLCDMVNGAPDDVVSWIPSGEAFRISDLARLESETLPQYFRHSRFQSLVRQLNFYNFRKINRERTFWVYYHPMFHRDRPEDMPKLKRRTCPGNDGRKNRPDRAASPLPPPPPPAGITWSGEDEVQEKHADGGTPGMNDASPAGIKVSRSPSPSYSPMDHPPAGKGSVRLKPVLSEEGSFVSWEGQNAFHRTVSAEARMHEYDMEPPCDPMQAEEYVADEFYDEKRFTKKSRKAAKQYWSDDDEDDSRYSYSGNRKKYTKEELQERQDHRLAVAEVSRHLNGICSDYAASIAKPRSATASPLFGLDKPHDHYYGAGKCDLFTYDCEDGFEIDVSNEKATTVVTPSKGLEPTKEVAVVPDPPSQSPLVIQSLAQACMDGRLGGCASLLERTLASAILSFCLSTHPEDPDLASKIDACLAKGPMLAKEFHLYYLAMAPSEYPKLGLGGLKNSTEDLKRKWRLFSSTLIQRVKLPRHHEALTGEENDAIERCVASWFHEV